MMMPAPSAPGEVSERDASGVTAIPISRRSNVPDLLLIQGVKEGDRNICVAFYRQLRPSIDGALWRVLGATESEHEDLVQSVMEQTVFSIQRGQFQGNCALSTWVTTIATRTALTALRKRYRWRSRFIGHASPEDLGVPHRGHEGLVEARQELKRVRAELSRLPKASAEAFLLHDIEGLSLKEVADALSSSPEAIRSKLFRARRKLRTELTSDQPGDDQ